MINLIHIRFLTKGITMTLAQSISQKPTVQITTDESKSKSDIQIRNALVLNDCFAKTNRFSTLKNSK